MHFHRLAFPSVPRCAPSPAVLVVMLVGCAGGGDDAATGIVDTGPTATTDTTPTVEPVTCDVPVASACGEAAVVRGVASVPDGSPSTGDLVVYLTHAELGQEALGGYYHHGIVLSDVDLSVPTPFQIDMCVGGEMWTAEWGPYNLILLLDQNGDNAPNSFASNQLPDPGEPSVRVYPVTFAANASSECLDDLLLDCEDGSSCAAF